MYCSLGWYFHTRAFEEKNICSKKILRKYNQNQCFEMKIFTKPFSWSKDKNLLIFNSIYRTVTKAIYVILFIK